MIVISGGTSLYSMVHALYYVAHCIKVQYCAKSDSKHTVPPQGVHLVWLGLLVRCPKGDLIKVSHIFMSDIPTIKIH